MAEKRATWTRILFPNDDSVTASEMQRCLPFGNILRLDVSTRTSTCSTQNADWTNVEQKMAYRRQLFHFTQHFQNGSIIKCNSRP